MRFLFRIFIPLRVHDSVDVLIFCVTPGKSKTFLKDVPFDHLKLPLEALFPRYFPMRY